MTLMHYPRKPVQTDLPILDAIKERWSPRAFSDLAIEEEKIKTMFEAARWAPSCFNEQPWRYVYASKDDEGRAALASLLNESNATWANDAYLLAVTFAKKTFTHHGKPNAFAMHDLGAASAYLVLQLPSLELIGHQMAGFQRDKANALLGVPEDFEPGSMIAIGYSGDMAKLSPEQQQKELAPRVRKDSKEFAFRNSWPLQA